MPRLCHTPTPRRLTLRSSGQPPGYRCLPLNSNVRALSNMSETISVLARLVPLPPSARAARPAAASARSALLDRKSPLLSLRTGNLSSDGTQEHVFLL